MGTAKSGIENGDWFVIMGPVKMGIGSFFSQEKKSAYPQRTMLK